MIGDTENGWDDDSITILATYVRCVLAQLQHFPYFLSIILSFSWSYRIILWMNVYAAIKLVCWLMMETAGGNWNPLLSFFLVALQKVSSLASNNFNSIAYKVYRRDNFLYKKQRHHHLHRKVHPKAKYKYNSRYYWGNVFCSYLAWRLGKDLHAITVSTLECLTGKTTNVTTPHRQQHQINNANNTRE